MTDVTTNEDMTVADLVTQDEYTPYGVAKVINTILLTVGVKEIPTQMMYNYNKNGLIVKGVKGRKTYTRDEVLTFVEKYITKKIGS